jgi:peptide/nickel transport system permease protein
VIARLIALFRRSAALGIGGAVLALLILVALIAPMIAPFDPLGMDFHAKLVAPGWRHPFGTDALGQDIFSRVLYGTRVSLLVGVSVVALAVALGTPVGLAAGYFGGWIDAALMRLSDMFLAFPPLLLPIALTAALGPGLGHALVAIGIAWFPWYARLVRGATLAIREEAFIGAAEGMGIGALWIIRKHILPNATTPILIQASMDFGYAILAAASLSFIGVGARPPAIEWGLMVAMARAEFLDFWWTASFPGLAIFVAVLAANLIGDGLRDLFDPKRQGAGA